MSKEKKEEPKAPKVTLNDVMQKTGLTKNQLVNLFTDIDLSEIAFKNERLKIKSLKAQRDRYFAQKSNLKESVEYRELLVRDISVQKELKSQQAYEDEVSKQLLEQIWPMIVPPADMSWEDHVIIKYLEKIKPVVKAKIGFTPPPTPTK